MLILIISNVLIDDAHIVQVQAAVSGILRLAPVVVHNQGIPVRLVPVGVLVRPIVVVVSIGPEPARTADDLQDIELQEEEGHVGDHKGVVRLVEVPERSLAVLDNVVQGVVVGGKVVQAEEEVFVDLPIVPVEVEEDRERGCSLRVGVEDAEIPDQAVDRIRVGEQRLDQDLDD